MCLKIKFKFSSYIHYFVQFHKHWLYYTWTWTISSYTTWTWFSSTSTLSATIFCISEYSPGSFSNSISTGSRARGPCRPTQVLTMNWKIKILIEQFSNVCLKIKFKFSSYITLLYNFINTDFNIPLQYLLTIHELWALLLPEHCAPPCLACWTILLLLCLWPYPQDLEQEDQEPQEAHWQLTGTEKWEWHICIKKSCVV